MNTWIDFGELRKRLDFAEVLRHYGVEVNLKKEQHHGFCPLPSHEGKRNSQSFSANVKRGIWQCFGCGGKGNVLDFAVLMERGNPKNGAEVRKVAFELWDRFLSSSPEATTSRDEAKEAEADNALVIFRLVLHALSRCRSDHKGFNWTPALVEYSFGKNRRQRWSFVVSMV